MVIGEADGVFENAATNHEAVNAVFLAEFGSLRGGFDVAVDEEFGFGGEFVAEFDDFGDEVVVRRDFGHFFFGTEVDGEGGWMFV